MHILRRDKAILIKTLTDNQEKLNEILKNHTEEFKTQEDILVLAAEEVDRLEKLLDKWTRKHEKLSISHKENVSNLDLLKVRVVELQKERDDLTLKYDLMASLQLSKDRADISRQKAIGNKNLNLKHRSSLAVLSNIPSTVSNTFSAPSSNSQNLNSNNNTMNNDDQSNNGNGSVSVSVSAERRLLSNTNSDVVALDYYNNIVDIYKYVELFLL